MNIASILGNNFVERVGWVLIHSLWQILLVAIVYMLFRLAFKSADVRYWSGIGLLSLIAIAPIATFFSLSDVYFDTRPGTADARKSLEKDSTNSNNTSPNAAGKMIGPVVLPERHQANESAVPISTPNAPPQDSVSLAPGDYRLHTNDSNSSTIAAEVINGIANRVKPFLPYTVATWLVGILLFSLRPLAGFWTVIRLQRTGLSRVPEKICRTMDRLSKQLRIRRVVSIYQSSLIYVPLVAGYFKPIILLPASAMTNLTAHELESILRHELAHIKRHDAMLNFLQTILETVFFFHPAVWWISNQVRKERENCCDDVASLNPSQARSLAQALLRLEEIRPAQHGVLAACDGDLKSRIGRLLSRGQLERNSRRRTGFMAAITTMTLVVIATVLLISSIWNSSKTKDDPKFTKVQIKSYSDTFEWKQFSVEDANAIAELLKHFPEADQKRKGGIPAGYNIDCQLIFSNDKDGRLVIGFSLLNGLWSEGDGDWKINDKQNLKSMLDELAKQSNKSDVDADGIAWGKPNAKGISVGLSFEPRKDNYAIGERVQTLFHIRNDSSQTTNNISLPRLVQPERVKWEVRDHSTNEVVEATNTQERQWVGGYFGIEIPPGNSANVYGPHIQFGGNQPPEDDVLIFVKAVSGQVLNLVFDVSEFMALTKDCQTGKQEFNVVTGYRDAKPLELVIFETLEQLKDIDPATRRLKFIGDRYQFDHEWTKLIADRYPDLWELDLSEVRNLDSKAFEHLTRIATLKSLRIKFAENLPVEASEQLYKLQNLEILDISYCEKWICDEVFANIAKLPNLHTLIMMRHSAGGVTEESLEQIAGMPNLRHVFVTQHQPLAKSTRIKSPTVDGTFCDVHVINDAPGIDYYSRDYVTGLNQEAGLVIEVSMPKFWQSNLAFRFPVLVTVRTDGSGNFEKSELSKKPIVHSKQAFEIEFDGESYQHKLWYTSFPTTLISPFRLELLLDSGNWSANTDVQLSGAVFEKYPDLDPGKHNLRVIFVGLGDEGKIVSEPIEFDISKPSNSDDSKPDETPSAKLQQQLDDNLKLYEAEKEQLHQNHKGEWMAIADGHVHGPFETLDKVHETVKAESRLVFRPGVDDLEVEFPLSPFIARSEENWIQLGWQFARKQNLSISYDQWFTGGMKLKIRDDGRAPFSILTPDGSKQIKRHAVCSSLFEDELVITENEVRELGGLANFRVPGVATYDKDHPGYKVFVKVEIPELKISDYLLAYVLPDSLVKQPFYSSEVPKDFPLIILQEKTAEQQRESEAETNQNENDRLKDRKKGNDKTGDWNGNSAWWRANNIGRARKPRTESVGGTAASRSTSRTGP